MYVAEENERERKKKKKGRGKKEDDLLERGNTKCRSHSSHFTAK